MDGGVLQDDLVPCSSEQRGGKARILMLSRYAHRGASSRVRLFSYVPALEAAGYSISVLPFFDDGYIRFLYGESPDRLPARFATILEAFLTRIAALLTTDKADLLWIEKEALPWMPYAFERALLGKVPWVVDFDDAWFLRYADCPSRVLRRLLRNKLESLVEGAALCVVGNRYLADWAHNAGGLNVLELPTVVTLDHYPIKPMPEGRFTVGWIGTPLTAPYLALIAEPLRTFCMANNAVLKIIGVPGFQLDGIEVQTVPWSEATEAAEIASCHVGIMPLWDGAWEQGKCGYKLIQFMAAGRPVIGSPVAVNREIINSPEGGFLARSNRDWLSALETLNALPDRGASLGHQARRRVEKNYELAVTTPPLLQSLSRIIKGN